MGCNTDSNILWVKDEDPESSLKNYKMMCISTGSKTTENWIRAWRKSLSMVSWKHLVVELIIEFGKHDSYETLICELCQFKQGC